MLCAILRSFQAGVGWVKPLDATVFEKTERVVRKLLSFQNIDVLYVAVNAERGNPLSEQIDNENKTPTMHALSRVFANEVVSGRLVLVAVHDWGKNPGSARAISHVIGMLPLHAEYVAVLSQELDLDEPLFSAAYGLARDNDLSVIGFLREHWNEKFQWQLPQNTGAIWNVFQLRRIGAFDPACDGTGETIRVHSPELGEIDAPVAGMEDFHAMLRMFREDPKGFSWGMIGGSSPLRWDVSFPEGSDRLKNHLTKVERQAVVMRTWVERIVPHLSWDMFTKKFLLRKIYIRI